MSLGRSRLSSQGRDKARELAENNPTRVHLVEKLERLVNDCNLGTLATEAFFAALKKLIAEMEEERRAAREGLTEEELAIATTASLRRTVCTAQPLMAAWVGAGVDHRLRPRWRTQSPPRLCSAFRAARHKPGSGSCVRHTGHRVLASLARHERHS